MCLGTRILSTFNFESVSPNTYLHVFPKHRFYGLVPSNLAAAGSEETAAGPQHPRKTAGTLHLQQVSFLKHPGPSVFYTAHSNSLCLISKELH